MKRRLDATFAVNAETRWRRRNGSFEVDIRFPREDENREWELERDR